MAPDHRKEDMDQLETDLFYCSPNDEKLAMSLADENVLEFYKNTVQKVVLENGQKYLQFKLPWAKNPNNL